MFGNQIANNQPSTTINHQQLADKIALLAQAIDEIKQNYQAYVIELVNDVHLKLNNKRINELANKSAISPQLIDQLIRCYYIGQSQARYNNWGCSTDDNGNTIQNFSIAHLQELYDGIFKYQTWQKLTHGAEINQDHGNTLASIEGTFHRVNGLLFNQQGQLIAIFTPDAVLSRHLYKNYQKTYEILFYNLEHVGIITPKQAQRTQRSIKYMMVSFGSLMAMTFITGFLAEETNNKTLMNVNNFLIDFLTDITLISLAVGVAYIFTIGLYLQHKKYGLDANGRLLSINYTKDDPQALVRRYRRRT